METQHQIKRTLSQPDVIEHISSVLDASDTIIRTKLADQLCEQFGFFDPRGKKQRSGCLKALRGLEKDGWFVLIALESSEDTRWIAILLGPEGTVEPGFKLNFQEFQNSCTPGRP